MGLIHDAKKQGLWPTSESIPRRSYHHFLSGLVVESAEGIRFAYTDNQFENSLAKLAMLETVNEPVELSPENENY